VAALIRSSQTANAILDANRTACGSVASQGRLLDMEFGYAGQGLSGKLRSIFDLTTGAFVIDQEIGRLKDTRGFDGSKAWWRDGSGCVTVQAGGDKHELAVNAAFRHANLWWLPDRAGAHVRFRSREEIDGQFFDVLTVTPNGGKTFEAWFETSSHLLSRIVEQQGFKLVTTFFDDYRPFEGTLIAHKVVVDTGSGAGFVQTMTLRSARLLPSNQSATYFAPQAPEESKGLMPGAVGEVTVPLFLLNNHIYIHVFVNGKGPFLFILDTGGHNMLSPATARALGLTSSGRLEAHGVGENVAQAASTVVEELRIGEARLPSHTVYVMTFLPSNVEGIQVDGMIGFETLWRFVTCIDYFGRTLTLSDPRIFDPKDAGTPIEFVFYEHLPQVNGTFEGVPCKFDIDTGSRAELTLTKRFVDDSKLRERFRSGIAAVDGWGIGGPARCIVIRAAGLSIEAVPMSDVITSLSIREPGRSTDPCSQGNIGSKLLKRFVVTFDYRRQLVYLKQQHEPVADSGTYDRAGMWINAADGCFEIADVTPNGPAAIAGLKVGQRIEKVDGLPANLIQLSDLRLRLRTDPPGTTVTLSVRLAGSAASVAITLRDQI
jgi:hypothetical protein